MALRRSICSRATLLNRRYNPTVGYSHDHDNDRQGDVSSRRKIDDFVAQKRSFGSYASSCRGISDVFSQPRMGMGFPGHGSLGHFHRYMSTSIGGDQDKVEMFSDVAAGVISDTPIEAIASQAPALSEVAVAAVDSAYPVAALQYVIDGVHSFTGLPWWASIALTTLLIRGCTVPFLINQLKATSKLSIMRPRLEEIKMEMETRGMDPSAVDEGKAKMNALFKEYGVTPFTPIKGIFIQAPVFISFFFAISNMAEKVPSFKNGGAFWFTDLTVPDSMYIFPVLTALTFLINVEFNVQEGLEGNPVAGTMKKFSRGLALLTVPFTMSFPQAIFCYWVTSNMFSFAYGSVLKIPGVKKALGVPLIPAAPPSTAQNQSGFNLFEAMKKAATASKNVAQISPPAEEVKPGDSRAPKAAVLSQRIKTLERQVKQRKKNKKR